MKENHAEYAKTLEEYEVLHDKMERKLDQHMRKETLLKDKNKKLKADLKQNKSLVASDSDCHPCNLLCS